MLYDMFIYRSLKPVRVISLDRELNGFKETSVLEIFEVFAAGLPMFCIVQRQGTDISTLNDMMCYGLITPTFEDVKQLVDIWRAAWLTGNEGVIQEIGVTWKDFSNSLEEDCGDDGYRIRYTGIDTDVELGFLMKVGDYHFGITRSAEEAHVFSSRKHAEMAMYSSATVLQDIVFKDAVNYLCDLHDDDLLGNLEKKVGNSWISQPEKQFIKSFNHESVSPFDYNSL